MKSNMRTVEQECLEENTENNSQQIKNESKSDSDKVVEQSRAEKMVSKEENTAVKNYEFVNCDTLRLKSEIGIVDEELLKQKYQCEICKKCFTEKHNLRRHFRSHAGIKSYFCESCDKTFTKKSTLTAHLRIHAGYKPFKCETCDRRFTEKGNLTKHLKVHDEVKPYQCEICNNNYAFFYAFFYFHQ